MDINFHYARFINFRRGGHDARPAKWIFGDSNPGPTGYEPVALTNWAKDPDFIHSWKNRARKRASSPSRARTYNNSVNSRVLYHWAIEESWIRKVIRHIPNISMITKTTFYFKSFFQVHQILSSDRTNWPQQFPLLPRGSRMGERIWNLPEKEKAR